jgi:hypothetical protein
MSRHSFYFKVVYTCQTINYDIDLDMSISEFLNYVKDKIRHDLGVDNNYEIEIVEAGQFDNVNGRDAEVAPALEHSDTTIREKFNNYNQTAFYIRPVIRSRLNLEQPQIENNSENNIIPTIPR